MKLQDMRVGEMLAAVGAKQPAPGGGAVASLTAALAAALGEMVVNYSRGKKRFAEHEALHAESLRTLTELRGAAIDLADADAEAYGRLNELWKLPPDDAARRAAMPEAARHAIDVPRRVVGACLGVLRILSRLCGASNEQLASDLAIAAALAEAGARAAAWNVNVNLPLLEDAAESEAIRVEVTRALDRAKTLCAEVEGCCGG